MAKLSSDQVEAVLRAARPLPPASHAAFLEDVSSALNELDDLGDGVIHRVIRQRCATPPLQPAGSLTSKQAPVRAGADPPDLSRANRPSSRWR